MTAVTRFFPPSYTSSAVEHITTAKHTTFDPSTALYVDVSTSQEADLLVQRGWTKLPMLVGATADRPSPVGAYGARRGTAYYDTTLSKPVIFDGAVWRDITGTAV